MDKFWDSHDPRVALIRDAVQRESINGASIGVVDDPDGIGGDQVKGQGVAIRGGVAEPVGGGRWLSQPGHLNRRVAEDVKFQDFGS